MGGYGPPAPPPLHRLCIQEYCYVQWRIQDGAFGANALVEEPAILVIEILNFMSGQDQFSYTTHENMRILLVLITISPETNNKLTQTNC